tara:strand:- start:2532 stop:2834 length:303 start_codon:yes stop_codon:yes gene_type:complete
MLKWTNPEAAGLLPTFLTEHCPDDAVTQFNHAYAHGGGWRDFNGFTLVIVGNLAKLRYSGDPDLTSVSYVKLRDERIWVFPHSWVLVAQPDNSFRVCRMD